MELATKPETRLALFIPPGNLAARPDEEAINIIKTIKAKKLIYC